MALKGRTVFFMGFGSGLLFFLMLAVLFGWYAVRYPQQFINRASRTGLVKVVEKKVMQQTVNILNTIPKDYLAGKQFEISHGIQTLTRAYSNQQLSSDEIQHISGELTGAMADQRLEPEEVDRLLKLIQTVSR